MAQRRPLIGFIGQGFIGKNYADDLERRGYKTVRYALEEPYIANKDKIRDCDFVFIAVPTPTTLKGFDDSIVRASVALVGKGKAAVIKSTIVPGTTKDIQSQYQDREVMYSPEFLSEATATHDAARPFSNIIGLTRNSEAQKRLAEELHGILPDAPFSLTCSSTEAEVIKYTHNGSGYAQIVFFNLMYDLAQKYGCNWNSIQRAIEADPMISNRYARPVHKSGRGAGGHCFIKDIAALRVEYGKALDDAAGSALFEALERKNIDLLRGSGKDLDLLLNVYGEEAISNVKLREVPKLGSVRGDVRLLIATETLDQDDPLLGFFHRWIEEFARHASRVHVVCLGQGKKDLPPNVSEHSLGKESARGSRFSKRILYSLRLIHYAWKYRREYNDVLVHLSSEYILVTGLLWKALGKRVGFWHNDAEASLRTRIAIALSDVLFYSSDNAFVAKYAHARKIPMGVDVGMYEAAGRRAENRSLLFLGRITEKKRLDVVLSALGHLTEKGVKFSFDIYGPAGAGDERYLESLRSKFSRLERKNPIEFKGSIPHQETPAVYAAHGIFIHVGSRRGFNKTLLEAAVSGCVVVTSDPWLRRVVDERLFVEKPDEEHIARAIEAALSLSEEERERERMKLGGYVRREHALSSVVPAMLEMLRRKGGEGRA